MIGSWWAVREPREKVLIMIAGALSLGVVAWFGIISPLMGANGLAKRDLLLAIEDKALVETALTRLSATREVARGPAEDFDVFRSEVTSLAQASGLAIFRLQAGADGTLQVNFNEVAPEDLFSWLEQIGARPGGDIVRASLVHKGDAVQAVIDFQGARS